MSNLPEIQLNEVPTFSPAITELSSSPAIGDLVKALAKAELKFQPLTKSSDNPYYKSKYADLESVIKVTRTPMAEEGLVVIQMPSLSDRNVTLTTLLAHSSGQWIKSTVGCPAEQKTKEGIKFDAQTIGSAISYLRRYSLQALTNLAADDDDGNAATGKAQSVKQGIVNTFQKGTFGKPVDLVQKVNTPVPDPVGVIVNAHGVDITDDDLPDFDAPASDPLPTPAQSKMIAERLRSYKQDSRKLKDWVEKEAGTSYKEISWKKFQDILATLNGVEDVGKLIGA